MKIYLCLTLLLVCCHMIEARRKKGSVIVLNDGNWRECLTGQWMVKFYAPWCPACKSNEADYKEFSEWSEDLNIKVAMVDITKEAGLSGRFLVTALPTFYYGRDGEFRRYNGKRSADAMHDYIDLEQWQGVEPVWWVRHPDSILMTATSWLFKTSIVMKSIHEKLTEDYGLSPWVSYIAFGAGTVATGLILGLMLVCIVDYVSPVKEIKRPAQPEASPAPVPEEAQPEEQNETNAEEKADDDAASSVADDEQEDNGSQPSARASQTSSRASQEWETIRDFEVADAEKELQQQESSQGGLRQRKTAKASDEAAAAEAGDTEDNKTE